eukprot:TRINITY_DN75448_c0_g1_i1.p1 TRINITY_DN75448_c0_g1~~TRINITY_DN75448_c0_g1_i1.p1  ORF type:complete len:333 (-),score=50.63 TRINITY_DN75448_c0_g1_i1:96-1094(-)
MGLPMELLPYAENLFRRFPEEFIALGMPGLEEIFDLRVNGTWVRRISETPTQKTVEVTIRRWPAVTPHGLPMSPPRASPYDGGMHMQHPWLNGNKELTQMSLQRHCPPQMMQRCAGPSAAEVSAAAAAAAADDRTTARLMRLEAALVALKPQIESVVLHQVAQSQAQSAQAQAVSQNFLTTVLPPQQGQSPLPSSPEQEDPEEAKEQSVSTPLRQRRNLDSLAISAQMARIFAQSTVPASTSVAAAPAASTSSEPVLGPHVVTSVLPRSQSAAELTTAWPAGSRGSSPPAGGAGLGAAGGAPGASVLVGGPIRGPQSMVKTRVAPGFNDPSS